MSDSYGDGGSAWWGWIVPLSHVLPEVLRERVIRNYLRACLEDKSTHWDELCGFLRPQQDCLDTPAG
jgi:hypothetical protein